MESFLVKYLRGDAVAQDSERISYIYFKQRNKIDDVDIRIFKILDRVKEKIAEFLDDPVLHRLHYASIRHHRNTILRLHEREDTSDLFARIKDRIHATRAEKRKKKEEGVPPEDAPLE